MSSEMKSHDAEVVVFGDTGYELTITKGLPKEAIVRFDLRKDDSIMERFFVPLDDVDRMFEKVSRFCKDAMAIKESLKNEKGN